MNIHYSYSLCINLTTFKFLFHFFLLRCLFSIKKKKKKKVEWTLDEIWMWIFIFHHLNYFFLKKWCNSHQNSWNHFNDIQGYKLTHMFMNSSNSFRKEKKKKNHVRFPSSSTTLGLTIKQAKLKYSNMFVQTQVKSI